VNLQAPRSLLWDRIDFQPAALHENRGSGIYGAAELLIGYEFRVPDTGTAAKHATRIAATSITYIEEWIAAWHSGRIDFLISTW
jgi:hypothetical protein